LSGVGVYVVIMIAIGVIVRSTRAGAGEQLAESAAATDPLSDDSDGDGIDDLTEWCFSCSTVDFDNPQDWDGDGTIDALDTDDDDDGCPDGSDPAPLVFSADTDLDGEVR